MATQLSCTLVGVFFLNARGLKSARQELGFGFLTDVYTIPLTCVNRTTLAKFCVPK